MACAKASSLCYTPGVVRTRKHPNPVHGRLSRSCQEKGPVPLGAEPTLESAGIFCLHAHLANVHSQFFQAVSKVISLY
jgi:hypothetical protein